MAAVLSFERPIRGAITAFSTCASPQCGQVISPAFCWASKPSPSRNHASNSWPNPQRKLNRIIERVSACAYFTPRGASSAIICRECQTMVEHTPSAWVRRFRPLIREGGRVLDLAAGAGRHTRLFLDMGFSVTAVDRDIAGLRPLAGDRCEICAIDLEAGAPGSMLTPLGTYDGIVVTNYLHRPLFPSIAAALAPEGVVIYETFAVGNERFGRPRSPDFLLRPGELLRAFAA